MHITSTAMNRPSRSANATVYTVLWLLLVIYATLAHLNFGDLDASIALRGFSVYDFSNSVLHPENFERDYPGGAQSIGKSSFPWLYPTLVSVGIPIDITLPVFIALEISILSLSAYFLLKTIFQDIHPIALLAVTGSFALSYIRFSNLARFGNPIFLGQSYGYADGLRLCAIALFLRNQQVISAISLLIAFTIHPIKTLLGFVFISGMQLSNIRTCFKFNFVLPFGVFSIAAFLWYFFFLSSGSGDFKIPAEDFFKYSPLYNSHWYPQDLGILSKYHQIYATPFLAAVLAGVSSLLRCQINPRIKIQLLLGISFVCLFVLIGLFVSWFELSPALVKISLQRGSVLVLSITTIIVIGQWISDLLNKRWWYAILLSILILSSFFSKETWPLAVSIVYALSTFLSGFKQDSATSVLKKFLSFIFFFILSYQLSLFAYGYQSEIYWFTQGGLLIAFITGSLFFHRTALNRYIKNHIDPEKYAFVIISFLLISPVYWSVRNKVFSDDFVQKGHAYKQVQLWAKNNTKFDSVFIIDPTIAYGWRDYSQRSSFGTLQEWYKTGWGYNSNAEALYEGLDRGARFGIDELIPDRVDKKYRSEFIRQSIQRAAANFYKLDGQIISGIAQDYDLQFVVMDNQNATKYGGMPSWPVAFKNRYFTVVIPPQTQ